LIAHLGETRGEERRRINFPPGRRRNRWWYKRGWREYLKRGLEGRMGL